MSKVTSKRQLTLPKAIADRFGIRPGDELVWFEAGESIRLGLVHPHVRATQQLTLEDRLALFDQGTSRLNKIQALQLAKAARSRTPHKRRGWSREDLYTRGFPR